MSDNPLGENHDTRYFEIRWGNSPIVVSVPHGGLDVPPELERYRTKNTRSPDIGTDLLAREILRYLKEEGREASLIVSRLHRGVLELNWWKSDLRGVPRLEDLYDSYYHQLHAMADAAVETHGFAVVVDIHGYGDGDGFCHGFPRGHICLGTRSGRLVPQRFSGAFKAFHDAIVQAGFGVYPEPGFSDYPDFTGGSIVESFMGSGVVMAVQVETPLSVRREEHEREVLARAIASALVACVSAAERTEGGERK